MTPRQVLATAALWLLLSGLLVASDSEPAVVVLGGIVAVLAAMVVVAVDLGREVALVVWPKQRSRHLVPREDDRRVAKLRHQGQASARFEPDELQGTLAALVNDRLRANRGIGSEEAAAAASTVLSPALRRLIEGRSHRAVSIRELNRVLSEIEEL